MSKWVGSIMACTAHPFTKLTATAASPSAVTPALRAGSVPSISAVMVWNAAR